MSGGIAESTARYCPHFVSAIDILGQLKLVKEEEAWRVLKEEEVERVVEKVVKMFWPQRTVIDCLNQDGTNVFYRFFPTFTFAMTPIETYYGMGWDRLSGTGVATAQKIVQRLKAKVFPMTTLCDETKILNDTNTETFFQDQNF